MGCVKKRDVADEIGCRWGQITLSLTGFRRISIFMNMKLCPRYALVKNIVLNSLNKKIPFL